jgi:hypothetical protein
MGKRQTSERYIDAYDAVLVPYSQKEITLVEIGIQNGGSLEVWSKFFPIFVKLLAVISIPIATN